MNNLFKITLVWILALFLTAGTIPADSVRAAGGVQDYAKKLEGQSKGLIALKLDDKPMEGYQLYYIKGGSYSYVSLKESGFTKLEEAKDYPGNYIVDISELDDEGRIPYGRFLLYDKKATEVKEYLITFDYDDVRFQDGNYQTVDFYTVSFEQGEIEVPELPNAYMHIKGSFDYWNVGDHMPENVPGYIDTSTNYYGKDLETGGYCFAWFEDSKGTKSSELEINAPVTLHPVFVNEQKVTSDTSYDYSGSNKYNHWYYDSDAEDGNAEQIKIKSGKELITALLDKKSNFLLIDSEVTLDAATAKKVLDAAGKYCTEWDSQLQFGIHTRDGSDFIIVEKGGKLTFDGVYMVCDVNWEPDESEEVLITVQDGGKLYFKNYSGMNYGVLSVQTKGEVVVDDTSSLSVNVLYNHGTITFAAPKKLDNERYSYLRALDVNDTFFNAKSGTINLNYREAEFEYQNHCWSVGGSYSGDVNRVGDLRQCRLRNNGTINITGNSQIEFGAGSGSTYQWDRVAAMPFVNNGTIKVDNDPTDSTGGHFFTSYSFVISYGSFINNGTLDITSNYGKNPVSETGSFYAYGGGINVYEGELVNYGTIDLKVKKGIGIYLNGIFFDPSECSLTNKSVDEIQKGRLNNKKGATINVKSSKNSAGIALGDRVELNNEGTIKLDYVNKKETGCNYPLLISSQYQTERNPVVNNNGTITNNAYIGYGNSKAVNWNGSKAKGKGKSGNIKASKDTITVPATTLKKVTGAKGSMKVTWKKQTKKVEGANIWGYEIQYSTDKKFENWETTGTRSVCGFGKTSLTIKDLKKGSYYVRIRVMYKDGSTTYSSYSKVKTVKVK